MKQYIAIIANPLHTLYYQGDTTYVLALEAIKRGYDVFYAAPHTLTIKENSVFAKGHWVRFSEDVANPYHILGQETIDLGLSAAILMRQDPPFDLSYISMTYALEQLKHTPIFNHPTHVRNAPEKLSVLQFPSLIPPTLITQDETEIMAFLRAYKKIIIKPLYGNGGAGVFLIETGDANLKPLLELYQAQNIPMVIQSYIPEVAIGDKRIILLDGQFLCVILRTPQKGEIRSNMHVGGKVSATSLTKREEEICETIAGFLQHHGLVFCGIDVIGSYLTEINVTSPTGIREANQLYQKKFEEQIWDVFTAKMHK